MNKLSNDELEDQGKVECCAHCGSLHITEEGNNLYCNSCGIVNYTEIITEEEYEKKMELKV